jgi:serine/threonine protein kinase/tetratricopeptide (TPR) repeat protein
MKCPKCHSENPSGTRFCGNCAAPLPPDKGFVLTETLQVPIKELTAGTTFARRYQIIEDLGKGGMGRVYKVFDTEVREKMALKLLHPDIAGDEKTIERFRNELKLARGISHRNVCRMFDLGREEETYYITMEYVPGEDLKSLIHRIGALPVGKAVSIGQQVCEGLSEAHRLGVVHRDLKPQNIMLDRDGNARIMDFGIARSLAAKGITGAGVMIGTPEYMSPEQVDGKEADQRSDIYSLGIIMFEMLTGHLPFEGDTPLSIAVKQKSERPPDPGSINAQIPDELSRIILKCLEKPKEKRYQSADELLAALAKIESGLPATTHPLPIKKPLTSKQITVRLPPKKVWIPTAAVLLMLAALLVWQFIPEGEGSKRTIAVLGFKNQTGDPGLDYLRETIPNLLITSLEQSKHLRVASWQRLKDLFRQAGRDEAAVYDEEAGFDVCRGEGIEAVVVGFYSKAGDTFVSDVKVLDAGTREVLKSASARGEGLDSILRSQVDEISRTISRGVGKPMLKLEPPPRPVIDLTTDSVEAYNYFLRGRDDYEKFYFADARKFLEKAIAIDPTFAVAHLYLGKVAAELFDTKAETDAYEIAKKYSGKASEKERLYIEAGYAHAVERDPDKRLRLLQDLAKRYPQEKQFHADLGLAYELRLSYPEAIREYEKALALDPDFGYALNQAGYAHGEVGEFEEAIQYFERYAAANPGEANPVDSIAELYFRMGKFDLAKAKYQEALEIRPDFPQSCGGLAYIFALEENYAETNHWLEEFIARAPTGFEKAEGAWLRAYYEYFLGRWDESLAEYMTLKEQLDKSGAISALAGTNRFIGWLCFDRGEYDLARQAFQRYFDLAMNRYPSSHAFYTAENSFHLGWVDLKQARLDTAKTRLMEINPLIADVDSGNRDRVVLDYHILEAEVFLAGNSLEKAVEAGKKIVPENFPSMNVASIPQYNIPFLKDVLARAYWKKRDLDKAIAEYSRLTTIDLDSQVRYLIHPLYHYRLGRVYEDKGDQAKAAAQYQKFLECWKDADATHPELADARKRLESLKPPAN